MLTVEWFNIPVIMDLEIVDRQNDSTAVCPFVRLILGLGAIIIAGDSSIKLLAKVTGGDKSSYHPC